MQTSGGSIDAKDGSDLPTGNYFASISNTRHEPAYLFDFCNVPAISIQYLMTIGLTSTLHSAAKTGTISSRRI
jgi:hypothetical protein